METASSEFYLCSATVVEHLQPSIISQPFRSGYDHDNELYYVAQFNYREAEAYYCDVIVPFNEKSRIHCNFWFRTCSRGHIDVSDITLTSCRQLGLFVAIERAVNLTQPKNIAIAIAELSDKFSCNPIEFIDKIVKLPKRSHEEKLREEFRTLLSSFSDVLLDKLMANEAKYAFGYSWKKPDWQVQLQRDLAGHVLKGDPRDVAIFAFFAHYHGWSTAPVAKHTPEQLAQADQYIERLTSTKGTPRLVFDSTTILGDVQAEFEKVGAHNNLDWTSYYEGWLYGRILLSIDTNRKLHEWTLRLYTILRILKRKELTEVEQERVAHLDRFISRNFDPIEVLRYDALFKMPAPDMQGVGRQTINIALQQLLARYPDDVPVRLHVNGKEIDFTTENLILTSETAYANDEAPEAEWDNESGKIELGTGRQYLLINPPVN